MLNQNIEKSLTSVRDRRAADQTGELNLLLLVDFIHHRNRGTVPKEDAFGIHRDGITQVVLPEQRKLYAVKSSQFTTVTPG